MPPSGRSRLVRRPAGRGGALDELVGAFPSGWPKALRPARSGSWPENMQSRRSTGVLSQPRPPRGRPAGYPRRRRRRADALRKQPRLGDGRPPVLSRLRPRPRRGDDPQITRRFATSRDRRGPRRRGLEEPRTGPRPQRRARADFGPFELAKHCWWVDEELTRRSPARSTSIASRVTTGGIALQPGDQEHSSRCGFAREGLARGVTRDRSQRTVMLSSSRPACCRIRPACARRGRCSGSWRGSLESRWNDPWRRSRDA